MGSPAVQQNINSSLSKIASTAKVENNTLTFISNEPVRTFEIKYHGAEGSSTFSTLGNQTPEHERLLKKNFREHDGALSTTTNIHSEGRYNCKITHLPDGKTKFEVTFDSKIQHAAIEVNNKVSSIKLKNGVPEGTLNLEESKETKVETSTAQKENPPALVQQNMHKEIDPSAAISVGEKLYGKTDVVNKNNASATTAEAQIEKEKPSSGQLVKHEIPTNFIDLDINLPLISREALRQTLANANPSAAIAYGASAITPREAASKYAMSAELEKKIHETKSAILKDTPKDIDGLKKQLSELDELQASHTKLHGKDVARLEKEASRSIEGSDLHKELNNKIKNINGVQESIKESRRNILENSAKATDSELSTFAKKELIKMRSEILSDYDNKISAAKSTQEVTKLTQEKADFKKANDSHVKEVGTKTEKLRVYVEGTKAYNAVRGAASSIYTAAKERVFGSPVQSAEKVLALETKDVSLRRLERLYQSLDNAESKVSSTYAKNNNSTAPDKLQELKARVALKIEEKLKSDISNAKIGLEKTTLQDELYEKHGQKIIKGKEILSGDTDAFRQEQKSYLDLRNREAVLKESGLKSILPSESKSVLHRLKQIDVELAKQPDSTLLKLEKEHLVAIKEKLILEKEIATYSSDEVKGVLEKRNAVAEVNKKIDLAKLTYIEELEKNIEIKDLDPKERMRLTAERDKLLVSSDEAQKKMIIEGAELEKAKVQARSTPMSDKIDEIHNKLETKKKELLEAKDAEAQKKLSSDIQELEYKKNRYNRLKIENEIDSNQKYVDTVQKRILEIEERLRAPEISSESDAKLKQEKKILSGEVDAAKTNKEFLIGKKELIDSKVELYEQNKELQSLRKAADEATDPAMKKQLLSEVDTLRPKVSELANKVIQSENSFTNKWNTRLLAAHSRMKEVTSKMNPTFAATVAGILSEASFAAMKADYSDEGVHSAIPSLITMFNKDLREWSEFTTADYGTLTAGLSEVTNAGGNVMMIGGGVYIGQKIGSYFGLKAPPVGVLRAAGLAGVAYHSFSSFSELDLVNATDTQVNGTIGSTLAAGAITGGTLGTFIPIPFVGTGSGVVVGVGVAFTMDLAGTAYNLTQLDDQYKNDYVKKGIKASILNARNGIVRAGDDNGRHVGTLSEDALEVIDSLTKVEILGQLFQGTNPDQSRMFTDDEIVKLGFKIPKQTMSAQEIDSIRRSNWERLENVYERGEGWVFRDQINYMKETMPELGTKFEALTKNSKDYYEDLYRRSYKIEFEANFPNSAFDIWIGTNSDDMGGVRVVKNELLTQAQTINTFISDLSDENEKEFAFNTLRKNFPMIDSIFTNENTAHLFINSFMVTDPKSNEHFETPLSNMLRQYYTALRNAPKQIDSNVAEIAKM